MDSEYCNPVRIFFCKGNALGKTRELLDEGNYEKPLVVCGRTATRKLEVVRKLCEDYDCFNDVEQNPSARTVDAIAGKLAGKDCVIAVGGGSVMDAAKAAAAVHANGGSTYDYLDGKSFTLEGIPVIAVPTTSGTSSEVTKYSVLTDGRTSRKKALGGEALYAHAAVEDPVLSYSMPAVVASSTGLDAFCHCVECVVNREGNPVSEALALKALSIINANLPASVAGDKRARDEMTLAVVLAGLAFDQTGTTSAHRISYSFTLGYGVPHGFACALTLPELMEENKAAAPEKIKAIEEVLGGDAKEKMLELMQAVKAPTRLGDVGVKKEDLQKLVDSIEFNGFPHDVLPVTRERVLGVLERIY